MLKKSISDSVVIDPFESSGIQDILSYEEIPVEVFDFQVRRLRNKEVPWLKCFGEINPSRVRYGR